MKVKKSSIKFFLFFVVCISIIVAGTYAETTINSNSVFYSNGSVNNVQDAIDDLYRKVSSTNESSDSSYEKGLLWDNLAPNSGFAGQTINLELSNCIAVSIYTKLHATSGYTYAYNYAEVGQTAQMDIPLASTSTAYSRKIVVSKTGIVFDAGRAATSSGASNNNSYIIPMKIYGFCKNISNNPNYIPENGLIWRKKDLTVNTFASQTITADLSGADGVIIVSNDQYNYVRKGETTLIRGDRQGTSSAYRDVTVTDTGITFADGKAWSSSGFTTNNAVRVDEIYAVSTNTKNDSRYVGALELKWTNPDTSGKFAAQTVSVDLTGCKGVVVKSGNFYNYAKVGTTVDFRDDRKSQYNSWRNGTVTETGITFKIGSVRTSDGNGGNGTAYVVPTEIYGVCN